MQQIRPNPQMNPQENLQIPSKPNPTVPKRRLPCDEPNPVLCIHASISNHGRCGKLYFSVGITTLQALARLIAHDARTDL